MSCHNCAATFGFLKKELGCPSCGFAFCNKCLKYEAKGLKSTLRVCRSCSQKQESAESTTSCSSSDIMDTKPPDVFLRRLETLEDPTRPPVTVYTQDPALQDLQGKLESTVPSEQELRGRLQKLRKRLVAAPSVEEMEERLARLQGMPLKTKSHSIDVSAMQLTGEEQTRRLIQQMQEETKLPQQSRADWHSEIEARLARLKGVDTATRAEVAEPAPEEMEAEASDAEGLIRQFSSQLGSVPQVDEESELAIVNKILAEVALEEKLEEDEISEEDVVSDTMEEELPWCCICNNDASLRCPGCAGDLYCARCFKEGHDVCDMEDHKPTSFQPKSPI